MIFGPDAVDAMLNHPAPDEVPALATHDLFDFPFPRRDCDDNYDDNNEVVEMIKELTADPLPYSSGQWQGDAAAIFARLESTSNAEEVSTIPSRANEKEQGNMTVAAKATNQEYGNA